MFFIMQKSAYEMRMRDWSSDVCSSDLHPRHLPAEVGRRASGGPHPLQVGRDLGLEADADGAVFSHLEPASAIYLHAPCKVVNPYHIGRASSRERVCHDV